MSRCASSRCAKSPAASRCALTPDKPKRLTLIRHANAEQDTDVRDFDRPLSRKGHSEANEMARRFQERGLIPDLILVSAAVRTRETADTFAKVLGVAARLLQADDSLYLADGEHILERHSRGGPARRTPHGHRPQPGHFGGRHFARARSGHQRAADLRHADDDGELRRAGNSSTAAACTTPSATRRAVLRLRK